MAIYKKTFARVVLATISILVVLCANGTADGNGHASCSDCHGDNHSLKAPNATLLCLTCHPGGRADHPLVSVPVGMPTSLPLDGERKMTCLTCHEPHGKGERSKLLRKQNEALCQDCHQK